jgi:hypothetical protein
MPEKRKEKFCPWCGERVRRSATRCPHCKTLVLTWRVVLVYTLLSIVLVASIFLLLDYLNIEFFK